MNEGFQSRQVKKTYLAIVAEAPKETKALWHYLVKGTEKINHCHNKSGKGAKSDCIIRTHWTLQNYSLLKIDLEPEDTTKYDVS